MWMAKIRPHKIQTPEPITIKFSTIDYVHETHVYTTFVLVGRIEAPAQIREI